MTADRPDLNGRAAAEDADLAVYEAPATIQRMLFATWALIYSMTPDQRALALRSMTDPGRLDWDFIPKPDRQGVPLAALNAHQRTLAHTLLAAGCSLQGYSQALAIMAMENVLRERERGQHTIYAGDFRNPDQYFFAFYGRPAFEDTWGWRILGHHLSLSYTIAGGRYLSTTPCNMGAQPATAGVLRPLQADEDLGFALLSALDQQQRSTAVIHDVAPADYVTRQVPRIGSFELPDYYDLGIDSYQITDEDRRILAFHRDRPAGIATGELSDSQRSLLLALVGSYLHRMPPEVADKHLARLEREGTSSLHFCWAGQQSPAGSHYYRIQGERFLIEFDNAIDNGNHIHSVWRDFDHDLGHGLLDHYERTVGTRHHLRTRLESSAETIDPSWPGR